MDIENYIYEAIFEEKEKFKIFYELIWEQFKEDGFVITDEPDTEIDCVFKAVALQNLVGEFVYRMYDEVNETNHENVVYYLAKLGIEEDEILDFCRENDEIDTFNDDSEEILRNALEYFTELVADKMLDEFDSYDIFNYMFTATYDFEQDFTFDFEDVDEFMAFAESNSDKLDDYKEEYPSVMRWINGGMVC